MQDKLIAPVHDTPRIVDILARAFQDDPAMAWIIPDPQERAKRLPRLFRIIAPLDLRDGLCLGSPHGEVATLWRHADRIHTPILDMALRLPQLLHCFGSALPRALALSDAIDAHHPKDQRFFYFHYAGVLPQHQGKGWGGAAIRAGIDEAQRQRLPILLETATPRNVGLYRAHGFETIREWDAPKDGPHFWTMWREVV